MAAGRGSSGVGAIVVLVALLMVAAAALPSGAFTICNVDASAAMACLSYVENGSPERSPRQSCCNAARGADIQCACGYRTYVPNGYSVNRAMEIPSKCGFGPSNPCG